MENDERTIAFRIRSSAHPELEITLSSEDRCPIVGLGLGLLKPNSNTEHRAPKKTNYGAEAELPPALVWVCVLIFDLLLCSGLQQRH